LIENCVFGSFRKKYIATKEQNNSSTYPRIKNLKIFSSVFDRSLVGDDGDGKDRADGIAAFCGAICCTASGRRDILKVIPSRRGT
jgi:hypothetical protein